MTLQFCRRAAALSLGSTDPIGCAFVRSTWCLQLQHAAPIFSQVRQVAEFQNCHCINDKKVPTSLFTTSRLLHQFTCHKWFNNVMNDIISNCMSPKDLSRYILPHFGLPH